MKNRFILKATAFLLSTTLLFSSCIGSFYLTQRLYAWNRSANNDNWVNELIFLALFACQVYTVTLIIDSLILNSIEFWTGDNPAAAQTKQIETEDGIFTITTDANGHQIQKEGSDEMVVFRFNAEENSWSLETKEQSIPLLQITGDRQANIYLADGSTIPVSAGQTRALAMKSH